LLSEKAIAAAALRGVAPDALYCLELLEQTGVVVVPGSGFGQADGTFHFRTTILPPEDKIEQVVQLLAAFHKSFLETYA
jgi:aspartate/methionine/tyrosine aminotransferase